MAGKFSLIKVCCLSCLLLLLLHLPEKLLLTVADGTLGKHLHHP